MPAELPLAVIQNAAFWHDSVCLACGHIQSPADPGDPQECVECDSPEVFPAELVLKCHALVAEESEP